MMACLPEAEAIGEERTMAATTPIDTDATSLNMVADGAANGATVGVIAFASGSGAVSYTLTDTAGGRFGIDAVTGLITVANAGLLDAADTSYTVEVEANDGDTTEVQTFTIRVVDASDLIEQTGDAALALDPAGTG